MWKYHQISLFTIFSNDSCKQAFQQFVKSYRMVGLLSSSAQIAKFGFRKHAVLINRHLINSSGKSLEKLLMFNKSFVSGFQKVLYQQKCDRSDSGSSALHIFLTKWLLLKQNLYQARTYLRSKVHCRISIYHFVFRRVLKKPVCFGTYELLQGKISYVVWSSQRRPHLVASKIEVHWAKLISGLFSSS